MNYLDQYNYWLNNPNLSKEGYDELSSIKDPKDLEYRFGAELKFGTTVALMPILFKMVITGSYPLP